MSNILSPRLMGLSGLQKALWDMIMALDLPVCIVSWFFLHQNEISERALLSHSSMLPSVIESLRTLI